MQWPQAMFSEFSKQFLQTQGETEWGNVEIGNCGNGELGNWGNGELRYWGTREMTK